MIAHLALGEQLADKLDRLPRAGERLTVGNAMLGLYLHFVAGADAENEAPVRDVVHARGGHGNRRRSAHEETGDARAEANSRSCSCDCGENCELVTAVTFGNPYRLISELFGEHAQAYDLTWRWTAGYRYPKLVHTLYNLAAFSPSTWAR